MMTEGGTTIPRLGGNWALGAFFLFVGFFCVRLPVAVHDGVESVGDGDDGAVLELGADGGLNGYKKGQ